MSTVSNEVALIPLTPAELERLAVLEGVIRTSIEAFLAVGSALFEIRDQRLYRDAYGTFEAYCSKRWGMTHRHANRVIQAADIIASFGDSPSKPTTEKQARPLSRLPRERRAAAWESAAKAAPDGKPTARQVEAAVEAIAPKPEPADIQAQRAAGIIPADAVVEIVEPEAAAEAEAEAEPSGEADLTDAEWLALCPARAKLSGVALGRFDVDALAYRRIAPHRQKYTRICKPITNAVKRETRRHVGPYTYRHLAYLKLKHPKHWVCCQDCKGSGQVPTVGACPSCHGEGYTV